MHITRILTKNEALYYAKKMNDRHLLHKILNSKNISVAMIIDQSTKSIVKFIELIIDNDDWYTFDIV